MINKDFLFLLPDYSEFTQKIVEIINLITQKLLQ